MNAQGFGTIVEIGDCLVSEDVFMEYFACDYEKCKGKCCIAGEYGAPLKEEELEPLENNYPVFSKLMSERGRAAVDSKGFFEIDIEDDIVTPVVPGTEECAYAHFEGDNCLCAIERCKLPKPISCKLYPIRVTNLTGGGKALNVHHWNICADAFEKGKKEGIRVYQFLREPLIDAFGDDFYDAICAAAKHLGY